MDMESLKKAESDYERYIICENTLHSGSHDFYAYSFMIGVLCNWKRYDDAIKVTLEALKHYYRHNMFLAYEANILYETRKYYEAIDVYKNVIKSFGSNINISSILRAKNNLAKCYFMTGDIKKTKKIVDSVLDEFPNDHTASLLQKELAGSGSIGVDNFDFSIDYVFLPFLVYEAETQGDLLARLYLLVVNCLKNSDFSKMEDVKHLYKEDIFLKTKGLTYLSLGDVDTAILYLEKTIALNRSLENLKDFAWCLRKSGNIKHELQRDIYNEVLLVEPDNSSVLFYLSLCTESIDDAIQIAKKAIAIDSENYAIFDCLADLYCQKKDYVISIENYQKARSIVYGENPSPMSFEIAKCYKMLNNIEQAKNEASRALIENPNNEEAKAFLAGLN